MGNTLEHYEPEESKKTVKKRAILSDIETIQNECNKHQNYCNDCSFLNVENTECFVESLYPNRWNIEKINKIIKKLRKKK